MARTTKPEKRKKTIPYNFGDKHKAYIRKSQDCMINVAEGAVRAGKTVDNVLAFVTSLRLLKTRYILHRRQHSAMRKSFLATVTALVLSISFEVNAAGVSTRAMRLLS